MHAGGRGVRIEPRHRLPTRPRGDLLQAGPLLVAGGAVSTGDGDVEGFSAASHQFDSDISAGRYPRAALALTAEHVLAVTCDGRSTRDAGMRLHELARFLVDWGAEQAINLDGGGSASLVSGGRLCNRPREAHGIDLLEGRRSPRRSSSPPGADARAGLRAAWPRRGMGGSLVAPHAL